MGEVLMGFGAFVAIFGAVTGLFKLMCWLEDRYMERQSSKKLERIRKIERDWRTPPPLSCGARVWIETENEVIPLVLEPVA